VVFGSVFLGLLGQAILKHFDDAPLIQGSRCQGTFSHLRLSRLCVRHSLTLRRTHLFVFR
jgi:hypothetical protein